MTPAALVRSGVAYATAGDTTRAERAYHAAIDVGHPDHTANAWFNPVSYTHLTLPTTERV